MYPMICMFHQDCWKHIFCCCQHLHHLEQAVFQPQVGGPKSGQVLPAQSAHQDSRGRDSGGLEPAGASSEEIW